MSVASKTACYVFLTCLQTMTMQSILVRGSLSITILLHRTTLPTHNTAQSALVRSESKTYPSNRVVTKNGLRFSWDLIGAALAKGGLAE